MYQNHCKKCGSISLHTEAKGNNLETYYIHELNLDKINTVDDCKRILKFLCDLVIKPLPDGVEYGGFSEVNDYFSR